MAVRWLEFVVGLSVVGLTLADVFFTILVPGPTRGILKVATKVRLVGLLLLRRQSKGQGRGQRQRLSNSFAPIMMFLTFASWILLLLIGFGAMVHASSDPSPTLLLGLGRALYVAGSSLTTLGVGDVDATAHVRWLIVWAALSGFGVITAVVTFTLQVQSSLHQREAAVLTLSGVAGSPPSGIAILETFADLDLRSDLPLFFKEWRAWSAAVLHSHVSYPVLVYFHSVDAEGDWLSALHAVLDAATIFDDLVDGPASGAATLMRRTGSRTAAHLCDVLDVQPASLDSPDAQVVSALVARLARAGYQTKGADEPHALEFLAAYAEYAGRFASLSRHLGAERTYLLP